MLNNKKTYLRLVRLQGLFFFGLLLCLLLLLWQPSDRFYWAGLFLLLLFWQNLSAWSFVHWLHHKRLKTPPPHFISPFWRQLAQHLHHLDKRHINRNRQISRFYKQFYRVAEVWPDGVLIYKSTGEIEWCNPKAQCLFSIQWPQQLGALVTTVIHHPVFKDYLNQQDYRQPLELEVSTNKRKVLSLHIHKFGKKCHYYLLVARDVTRMYYLDRTRKDFIANASHELRTPLTVIHGFLETFLDEEAVCPDWLPYFALMQQQTLRMESIVEDLLTLSTIEASKNIEKTSVNIPMLLQALVNEAQILSGKHQHQFNIKQANPTRFYTNEKMLYMIMSNLVFNAVHYTADKTAIDILWQQQKDNLIFQVTDYGEGISARHIPRLTERFYQVDKSRSREKGGTGLGLAIVKHAVHQLHGKLHIHSTTGKGSVFTVAFIKG